MVEWLVDLKHKLLKDKEVMKIVGHKVDVMKIWSKSSQWLPRTSLTNFQIANDPSWVYIAMQNVVLTADRLEFLHMLLHVIRLAK